MANLKDYPVQSRKCGAHCRTTGRPCRTWAMPNGKCKMHGGKSPGAPRGQQHPNYRGGKYTREAKQVSAFFREMRRDADVLTATVMNRHGLRPVKAIRRKAHVRRALAEAKAAAKAKEPK